MNKINLESTAKQLAVELTIKTGELWQVKTYEENRDPDIYSPSAWLHISEDWRTHRLTINATEPRGMSAKTYGEKITCDPARRIEAITADIISRLLPHARQHFTESKAWDAEKTREKNAKQLRGRMIKKYLPREYQDDKFCSIEQANRWKERVYAETTYDNLIKIEVNLPLGEALQLLKQLTKG